VARWSGSTRRSTRRAPLSRSSTAAIGRDPLSGSWFVFRGKRGDRLKILYWDGDGYAIWQKRLEVGTFEFPKVALNVLQLPNNHLPIL
jgi:transposase